MKLHWILGGAIALSVVSCGGEKENEEHAEATEVVASLTTEMDSVCYAIGINISEGFTQQKVSGINGAKMAKGFNDFVANAPTMTGQQSMDFIQKFMMNHQAKVQDTLNTVSYESSLLDSVSYALGVNVSETLKKQGVENLNGNALAQGFSDFSKNETVIDNNTAKNILQSFGQKQQAIQAEKAKLAAGPMIEAGATFLAENAKRAEVKTLPSGLQYEVITEGKGEIPTMENTVSTHYHGTLLDGTVFDSSVERGQPAQFGVGQVISGWTEALQLMPVGSKWKLYIPYNLAYGERGSGAKIQPYSTLIFDIELLEIVK